MTMTQEHTGKAFRNPDQAFARLGQLMVLIDEARLTGRREDVEKLCAEGVAIFNQFSEIYGK